MELPATLIGIDPNIISPSSCVRWLQIVRGKEEEEEEGEEEGEGEGEEVTWQTIHFKQRVVVISLYIVIIFLFFFVRENFCIAIRFIYLLTLAATIGKLWKCLACICFFKVWAGQKYHLFTHVLYELHIVITCNKWRMTEIVLDIGYIQYSDSHH